MIDLVDEDRLSGAGMNSALGGEYAPCPSDTKLVRFRLDFIVGQMGRQSI